MATMLSSNQLTGDRRGSQPQTDTCYSWQYSTTVYSKGYTMYALQYENSIHMYCMYTLILQTKHKCGLKSYNVPNRFYGECNKSTICGTGQT